MGPGGAAAGPLHDCRLTARCFRECFGFRAKPPYDFASFRPENTCIETFFARRQRDPDGGEGGEHIGAIKAHPTFALHVGKMRGATWFERPLGVVWLLGIENHDERHQGRSDAYDIFARQEAAGELFPLAVDYKLLELSHRIRDSAAFEERARADAHLLISAILEGENVVGELAGVPTRLALIDDDDPIVFAVAVSTDPVTGPLSRLPFPLTNERFWILASAVENVAHEIGGSALAEAPNFEFPGGMKNERGFLIAMQRP